MEMVLSRRERVRNSVLGIAAALAGAGAWLLLSGQAAPEQVQRAAQAALRMPSGAPQLVAIDALPEAGQAMCEWTPASAETSLLAALQERQEMRSAAMAAANERQPIDRSGLKPVRTIRDPYAAYSSVAVDPVRNEVVLTDENLFQILVYDRLANTPPTATMTEPKRIIGGEHTKIEFQCGLYIDPQSGDIYAVNNDTVDTMVIFSREAKGDVPPTRELYTPHGTFGVAVDESTQEMFLTVQHENSVVVYHKMATKKDAPLRLVQGLRTGLADPHGIALDTKNQLMFVTNHGSFHEKSADAGPAVSYIDVGADLPNWPKGGQAPGSGKYLPPSITVYPLKANGDVAPLRTIQGPKSRLNWPTGLAVNEQRGELYVSNDMEDSILVFDVNASGDAAPKRVLKGPKTLLKNPTGVWLDTKNNEVWAANFGNHSATVYPMAASGDTAPLRVIRSGPLEEPALGIGNPHPIAYDSKREEIIVPN
jgi:DNA-binding beta-propeller fold protein YncE